MPQWKLFISWMPNISVFLNSVRIRDNFDRFPSTCAWTLLGLGKGSRADQPSTGNWRLHRFVGLKRSAIGSWLYHSWRSQTWRECGFPSENKMGTLAYEQVLIEAGIPGIFMAINNCQPAATAWSRFPFGDTVYHCFQNEFFLRILLHGKT